MYLKKIPWVRIPSSQKSTNDKEKSTNDKEKKVQMNKEYFIEHINFYPSYFIVALIVWCIGVFGIISIKKNTLLILMSIEIMLLSIDLIFIGLSFYLDDLMGQDIVIKILTVAEAEAAIGLAILVSLERVQGTVLVDYLNNLKG